MLSLELFSVGALRLTAISKQYQSINQSINQSIYSYDCVSNKHRVQHIQLEVMPNTHRRHDETVLSRRRCVLGIKDPKCVRNNKNGPEMRELDGSASHEIYVDTVETTNINDNVCHCVTLRHVTMTLALLVDDKIHLRAAEFSLKIKKKH